MDDRKVYALVSVCLAVSLVSVGFAGFAYYNRTPQAQASNANKNKPIPPDLNKTYWDNWRKANSVSDYQQILSQASRYEHNPNSWHSPPSVSIGQGFGVGPYDYVVFQGDKDNYYAKSGDNGQITYEGSDASTVVQNAVDSLSRGTVYLKGFDRPSGVTTTENVSIIAENLGDITIDNSTWNFNSVNTEQVLISQSSLSYPYTIFRDDSGVLYAVNNNLELVAGGPDSLGVSNNTDMAELIAEIVNNVENGRTSIKIVNGGYLKSAQTLNAIPHLFGSGKNISTLTATSAVDGENIFTITDPASNSVMRIDSLKFQGGDSHTNYANCYFDLDNVKEICITNTEFRDAQGYGIKAINTHHWNCIALSWFVDGAGFYFEGDEDIQLIGDKIKYENTICKVENYSEVKMDSIEYKLNAPEIDLVNANFPEFNHTNRPDVYLLDSFGDGNWSSRDRTKNNYPIPLNLARTDARIFRPEWELRNGSPSTVDDALSLTAGDTTEQSVMKSSLEDLNNQKTWEFDWQFQTAPTAGVFAWRLMVSGDLVQVKIGSDNSFELMKREAGTWSTLISNTWAVDNASHTTKVTRDLNGNWELFLDGTSQGTATDTILPSGELRTSLINQADAEIRIDRVIIY